MVVGTTFELRSVASKNDAGALYREIFPGDGILKGCGVSFSARAVTVASGYFIACGRVLWEDGAETINVTPTVQSGYMRLRYRIDLSVAPSSTGFSQGSWAMDYNATSSFQALKQEDINDAGTIYEIEFAVFQISGGNITALTRKISNAIIDAEKLGGLLPAAYAKLAGAAFTGAVSVAGKLSTTGAISTTNYSGISVDSVNGGVWLKGDGYYCELHYTGNNLWIHRYNNDKTTGETMMLQLGNDGLLNVGSGAIQCGSLDAKTGAIKGGSLNTGAGKISGGSLAVTGAASAQSLSVSEGIDAKGTIASQWVVYAKESMAVGNDVYLGNDGYLKLKSTDIQTLTDGSLRIRTARQLLTLLGHFYPEAPNTYDMGGGNQRWRTLYCVSVSQSCGSAEKKQEQEIVFGDNAETIIDMIRSIPIRSYRRYVNEPNKSGGSERVLSDELELGIFIDDAKDHESFDLIGRKSVDEDGKENYGLDAMSWATAAHLRAEYAIKKAEKLEAEVESLKKKMAELKAMFKNGREKI